VRDDDRVVDAVERVGEPRTCLGRRLPAVDRLALEVATHRFAMSRVVRKVRLAPHLTQTRIELHLDARAHTDRLGSADRLRLGAREDAPNGRQAHRDLLGVGPSLIGELPGRRRPREIEINSGVPNEPQHRVERMHILVLGGTQFLGRHVVDAALQQGHDVTMFNRGQTRPELFPDVEKLRGDRDGDLGALDGRRFDAVVDTSGYVSRIVQTTLDALDDVGHYTFVSSVSAYASLATPADESAPVAQLTEENEVWRSEAYGALKALCEDAVRRRFPDAFIPRPGLIVGPWDPTGRFTYWPARLAEGGRVLAPAPRDAPAQVIDVRDLARWIVLAAETGLAGTFNAVDRPTTRAALVETCRRAASDDGMGTDAEVVWVEPDFLLEQAVGEWMELPLWLHASEYAGMLSIDPARAFAAGLQTRPLAETAADTLAWVRSGEAPADPPAGLARDKERAVLDSWLSKD
jgi:2'-hydroxyisoflavone reductase